MVITKGGNPFTVSHCKPDKSGGGAQGYPEFNWLVNKQDQGGQGVEINSRGLEVQFWSDVRGLANSARISEILTKPVPVLLTDHCRWNVVLGCSY